MNYLLQLVHVFLLSVVMLACTTKNPRVAEKAISQLNLKRGDLISCGPSVQQFGAVEFETTCKAKGNKNFDLAIALLHSFEYDEAEKAFAKVIDETSGCAMAYWGVAMCNFHPLWTPPTLAELQKGAAAIAMAKSITLKSAIESDFINALELFYKDWNKTNLHTRCLFFEKAMEQLHIKYPADLEAAAFYALALDASADPRDKSYANQKKAADNSGYPKSLQT